MPRSFAFRPARDWRDPDVAGLKDKQAALEEKAVFDFIRQELPALKEVAELKEGKQRAILREVIRGKTDMGQPVAKLTSEHWQTIEQVTQIPRSQWGKLLKERESQSKAKTADEQSKEKAA